MRKEPTPVAYVEVVIDGRLMVDWESFHKTFIEALGFPDFYGRNMNAWIDCMTSLDVPSDGMSRVHAPAGGMVVLRLDHVKDFSTRCPEQYAALVQCSSFVNWRRLEVGEGPIIALSFHE